jgi:hypothetical protein
VETKPNLLRSHYVCARRLVVALISALVVSLVALAGTSAANTYWQFGSLDGSSPPPRVRGCEGHADYYPTTEVLSRVPVAAPSGRTPQGLRYWSDGPRRGSANHGLLCPMDMLVEVAPGKVIIYRRGGGP